MRPFDDYFYPAYNSVEQDQLLFEGEVGDLSPTLIIKYVHRYYILCVQHIFLRNMNTSCDTS